MASAAALEIPDRLNFDDIPSILLPYQQQLLATTAISALTVYEKSRRIGVTWAAGADAVLTSSAGRNDGGMDSLYIGYNLDMAREFIDTCAMWAKKFVPVASAVEEFFFTEQGKGKEDRDIHAFRIRFASGFQIVALSSRPRSLRGRQGFVIIDEAAFHDDLGELLKAAMALTIWGGKVLVISTHDGENNAFNNLIAEIRSGRRDGVVLRTDFKRALAQGLYNRICLATGKQWSEAAEEEWEAKIRKGYGEDAAEELDCVPSQGSGVVLTSVTIKSCMINDAPVIRLKCPKNFEQKTDAVRKSYIQAWLDLEIEPNLRKLDPRLLSFFGQDFARSVDLSVIAPAQRLKNMTIRCPFVVELRNVPFREQEQILFFIIDRLPRFQAGKMDGRGNGQALSEFAQQRYGFDRIEAVMATDKWYLEHMPLMVAAFEDNTIQIPMDSDIETDLRQIRKVKGIAKVPDQRTTDKRGKRHGDFAIAACMLIAATNADVTEIDFMSTDQVRDSLFMDQDDGGEDAIFSSGGGLDMGGFYG